MLLNKAAVGWRTFTSNPVNFRAGFMVTQSRLGFRPRAFFSSITSMPSKITPPQPPPRWNHTADEVSELTKAAIAKHRAVEAQIGALQGAECTFESVFVALERADTEYETVTEPLSFYQNVAPSKALRDSSTAADGLVREYGVESSMRLDVFNAKLAAEKNLKDTGRWNQLSPEEQRLVEKMILAGKRAGLGLPEDERKTLMDLQKQLSQTCLELPRQKNFNEENGFVSFTREELDGVPEDVISGYKKTEDGKYHSTFKTPDIFPIFKFANLPETRKRAYEGHESRLEINVPLAEKFLHLRREIAKVLKYPTWADYRTEPKMVKTGKGVTDFLDDLQEKLKPVGEKDRENLLALKEKDCKERGIPFDGTLWIWDYRYYDRKYVENSLDLDDMLVKEYFPVSVVVPAIINIYQNLLGVRFETIEGETWHPDVQQYSVWEKDATDETGFVGYCYLDLFPRESKYSHAAVWPILSGYTRPDGKRSYPLVAMVANLAKETPDKPALMRHDDVVTFYHEKGHVFHGLLSNTKFAMFHGTKVARDFVEAPSQMLENWCWEPSVLEKISSHYKTKQPLSPELIDKIIKSRYVNVGLQYLRQVFFGKFDIKVHVDQAPEDYTLLWNNLREKISLVKSDKPCPGQGSFGHISGGYDAGYYGYLYSLVFAADMYSTVFKGDPLDPARGKLYRDKILKYGGSREELDSLKDFLGRDPNSDAFMKELFGAVPSASL
ncbi:metallopeptidase MepB [Roridomyces roridus]|uniref:Metallopeptidase MepB n=1 Tax=Roridomyces roridus TaxID=1738132 RepID=A0AAD7FXV4_9AGAR|nr:metallopeptidase MepB [Roridomyces roridus]